MFLTMGWFFNQSLIISIAEPAILTILHNAVPQLKVFDAKIPATSFWLQKRWNIASESPVTDCHTPMVLFRQSQPAVLATMFLGGFVWFSYEDQSHSLLSRQEVQSKSGVSRIHDPRSGWKLLDRKQNCSVTAISQSVFAYIANPSMLRGRQCAKRKHISFFLRCFLPRYQFVPCFTEQNL